MKKIVSVPLFFFTITFAGAQKTDTAHHAVYYTLKHITDSTRLAVVKQENMILYIGDKMNMFLSLDKLTIDSAILSEKRKGNDVTGLLRNRAPVMNTEIVTDKSTCSLIVKEVLFRGYFYSIPCPEIFWHITNEVKQISGYTCKKAEGYYKGRIYHVWFTTEAKLEGAPWKLTGLPGIVLEAYDTRKQVFFVFNGIEKINRENFIIHSLPENAIETTRSEFLQMREAFWDDPIGFANATNPENGMQIKITLAKGDQAQFKMKRPPNPLELVDD